VALPIEGPVLGVWAHPDDETYLSAGLMAAAVDAGMRVIDVTATRGEGGTPDPETYPPETMAAVREAEMAECLRILGVTEHLFLDLIDVDMDTPLSESGAAAVHQLMAEIQPMTVLTFGPDGMTGHVAHQQVSRWAADAFAVHAPPGARLFYATTTPEWAAEWVPRLERFDLYRPGTPPLTPRADLGIDYVLDAAAVEQKMAALAAHESQVAGLLEVFGDGLADAFGAEQFALAATKEYP
jgi:LmbE family N-acetylglucosaminyl deacetylase